VPKFEVFDPQEAARVIEPFVSLQRKGTFTLNRAAFDALGQPSHVELLFDRDDQVIGFRPVNPSKPTAYAVRSTDPSGSFAVAGKAFVKHYGIETAVARRWPAVFEHGVLCVQLGGPREEVVGRNPRLDLEAIAAHTSTRSRRR
jgi:hypothetical protein